MTSTPDENNPYSLNEEILRERLNSKELGRKTTQIFAGFLGLFSMICFGTILGWSNPTLKKLFEQETFLTIKMSWTASLFPLGCAIGFMSWSHYVTKIGPRKALLIQAPFTTLSWIILATVDNFPITLIVRFTLGIFGISYIICSEILILESLHKYLAECVLVIFYPSMYLGVMFVHILGFSTSTLWCTIACGVLPPIHFFLLTFIRESPVFLYTYGEQKSEKALAWYRGEQNVYMAMKQVRKDYKIRRMDPDTYDYMIYSKVVSKGIFIILGVIFFQVSSGYYFFIYYNSYVWQEVFFISPFYDTFIIATCLCVSNFFWSIFHFHFNLPIRPPLILSCLLTAISLTMLAIYLAFDYYDESEITRIPLILYGLIIFSHDMGLGYYPKVLLFNYMPYQVYIKVTFLCNCFFWLIYFICVELFIPIQINFPNYVIFSALAGLLYIGTIYCYLFVIETKGKSLMQIQMSFGGNPIGTRRVYLAL